MIIEILKTLGYMGVWVLINILLFYFLTKGKVGDVAMGMCGFMFILLFVGWIVIIILKVFGVLP